MSKNVVLYVFVLLSFTSCLDQEKSNYNLKYESYKIDGVYIKDCAGEPVAGATLRLYTTEERDLSLKILAQTTTDSEGLFSLNYLMETSTYRYNYNGLLIYSYDEINKVERLISNRLSWQQDLFVELINELSDTISISTRGLNQLNNADTLFLKEVSYPNANYKKQFTGPFSDGQTLDLIVRDFQSYYPFELEWYISDSCFYGKRNVNCHPGNYGFLNEVVPYCNRLNLSIDLSNAVN